MSPVGATCASRCNGAERARRRAPGRAPAVVDRARPAPEALHRARTDSGMARAPWWWTVGSERRSLTRSPRLPQGRRVRRVIRRVDPWTVLRFSVFFYLSIFLVLLVAGIALWQVASVTGVRDH